MSWLGNLAGFESFNLKDMWKGIKKNPERLLLGAADPFSSKVWGKVTGKNYEPLIDQMGGPYGGHTISAFGENDGGVYGRARAAGVDTGAGENMNDLAHIISAFYGGQALGNMIPHGGGGQGGGMRMPSPMQQQPQQQRPQSHQMIPNTELEEYERRRLMAEAMKRGGVNA